MNTRQKHNDDGLDDAVKLDGGDEVKYEDKGGSVEDDHADGIGHHHRRRQQQHPQHHRVYQQYDPDYRCLHVRQNKHGLIQSLHLKPL